MQLPGYIESGSNLIGPAESLVLYWTEISTEKSGTTRLKQQRISSFDRDLQDGWVIQAIVANFLGKGCLGHFGNMRMECSVEADFKHNGERVIEALKEIGINTHLQPQDFVKASMRELMLF